MKKSLLAVAVAAALPVVAHAQVTLSGSIATGIIDSGAPGAKAKVDRFGGGANAININSTEKIAGGLSAGFSSQMRFHPSTGNMASNGGAASGNALFHVADLFVSGGFGTVRMGKVSEASNCAFDPWGCLTGTGSLITGTAAYLLAGTPQANSIRYITPSISGLQASFQTTLNRANEDRQVFVVTYAAGPIVAQYLRAANSPASGSSGQNGETGGLKAMEHGIGLSYKLPMATLMFNHINKENAAGTKTSSVNNIGASIPLGTIAIWAGYSKDSKAAHTADNAWALGVNYPLSKRTSIGADVFEKEVLNGSTGFVLRARHTF